MKIIDHTKFSSLSKLTQKSPFLFSKLKNIQRKLQDKSYDRKARQKISNLYDGNSTKSFSHIALETISKCNGRCSFCPVNRYNDPRQLEWMDKKVFDKVINELSELNYDGVVSFFGNNEPFLDKRLIDCIENARPKLKNSIFSVYTNGTVLDVNKFLRIYDVLDELVIDNYNDAGELNTSTKKIVDYIKKGNRNFENLTVKLRLENQIMDSRAGNSPNKKDTIKLNATCVYPFYQMNIIPNGDVSLCCNDAFAENVVGNVKNETLNQIWQGEKLNDVRQKIIKTRQNIDICKGCDSLHDHWSEYEDYNKLLNTRKARLAE